MRLLADENVAGETVEALRQQGHDVAWVRTGSPGLADEEVLRRAVSEGRIVVTFDKDFGELAFGAISSAASRDPYPHSSAQSGPDDANCRSRTGEP